MSNDHSPLNATNYERPFPKESGSTPARVSAKRPEAWLSYSALDGRQYRRAQVSDLSLPRPARTLERSHYRLTATAGPAASVGRGLLVSKGGDRVESSGLARGIETEENSNGGGKPHGQKNNVPADRHGVFGRPAGDCRGAER